MAMAITGLAALFQSTRGEVAEMRAELVSLRSIAHPPLVTASVPVSTQSLHQTAAHRISPNIANLRTDKNLAAQAEQLVADLSNNITGTPMPLLNNVKRGLVRSRGDLAPSVKTPWPQDFVLGSGKQLKLYYQHLSIYEWDNRYICIVQHKPNPLTARL
jgi:hypothetical protein